MAQAVKDYYNRTERMVGIKPAGRSGYHQRCPNLLRHHENGAWRGLAQQLEYFRLGASRLANNLLSDIKEEPVEYF